MPDETPSNDLIALTAGIAAEYIANNTIATSEVPALIASIHGALSTLGAPPAPIAPAKPKGAVGIRTSIKPEHLISMIDGKPYKMLRRHLTTHGHTPESYREAYGLPANYPMVAASYAEQRSALARTIGLGRKPKAAELASASPKPRGDKLKLNLSS